MREREIEHIATSTYPQPRGWNTPSSSWPPPGWWRWPPEMIYPLRQGTGMPPDWFFIDTELQRRNFWSRVISGVFWIYRIFGRWFHAKMGHEGPTRHQGAPEGAGAPWWLWPPRGSSGPPTKLLVPLLFEKIIKKFCCIWRTFISVQKTTPR